MNKKISIPFKPYWKEKMKSGIKTCTSRTRKYGDAGDTFNIFDKEFVLTKVEKISLDEVQRLFYKAEGCANSGEFCNVWDSIHPIKGFDGSQLVWLHHFKVLEE